MSTFKTTWHHIRRSPFQSLIAFFVMFICFIIISVFLISSQGMSLVLNYFETRPEVTVYLQDGLDKDTVDSLQKELASYSEVKEIRFISKEKALDIYKEQNQDNPLLTEMVTASILPASFEISASNPDVLNQIAQNFSAKTDLVDDIIYQKNMVETILVWTRFVRKGGIAIASSTLLFTFFLVLVIIGMKITSRKEEIRISRLLGASKYYVKKSFLLEGFFYGFLGSFLGAGLVFSLALYFRQTINSYFAPIDFIPNSLTFFTLSLLAQMVFGIIIGYFASWIGVKRYIKY